MQIKYIALLFNYYFIIFLEKRYISPKEKLHSRKKHKLREFSKYPLLLTPPFSISRRGGKPAPWVQPFGLHHTPFPWGLSPKPPKNISLPKYNPRDSQKTISQNTINSSSRTNRTFARFLGQTYAK